MFQALGKVAISCGLSLPFVAVLCESPNRMAIMGYPHFATLNDGFFLVARLHQDENLKTRIFFPV